MHTNFNTRFRPLAFGAVILCLNGGCVVGPEYQAPKADLAPLHNASNSEPASSEPSPPLDQWWTGFQDPTLTRIVERTLGQNLELTAALARVDQARAVAQEAGARLLPQGDLQAQVGQLHQSLGSPIGAIGSHLPGYYRNQTLYDLGVGASWEIDLFGGLRRAREVARADAEAAEAGRLGVRVTVAAEAADAYLQIRGDQVRLEVAQKQITADANLLELVRLRIQAGAAADRELAQSEALLAAARASIPPLRTELEGQLNRLDVMMGAQPGTYSAELRGPREIPKAPGASANMAPEDLLRRRPDIIVAERHLAASNARIGVAIAEYYPKVSLAGLIGFEGLGTAHLLSSDDSQLEAAGGLRWRLFDFGRVDSEVAHARGVEAEALAEYRQTVLRAAEDVEDSLVALIQLRARSTELAAEVDALTRARDTAEKDYKAGAIALTDVLDADRELLAAQDDLVHARADTARAAVGLFRALGGGW
jgi:NodT family efflux transporter outer membrane factor (OMF) lipoprotein